VVAGWEVAAPRSDAALTLADRTPLAKVLVRAPAGGSTAAALGVPPARAGRHADGTLVTGSGPGEWTLLAASGRGPGLVERWQAPDPDGGLVSAVDLTSARVLLRLTGAAGRLLLAKVCAVDFDDTITPDGTAFRTSVAKVVTDVVRDDVATPASAPHPSRLSYLLHCDGSFGRYLFDALLDAGKEFGIGVDGFPEEDPW
jgi:heterotetrameric sarcosine oxidase gamma subunit